MSFDSVTGIIVASVIVLLVLIVGGWSFIAQIFAALVSFLSKCIELTVKGLGVFISKFAASWALFFIRLVFTAHVSMLDQFNPQILREESTMKEVKKRL